MNKLRKIALNAFEYGARLFKNRVVADFKNPKYRSFWTFIAGAAEKASERLTDDDPNNDTQIALLTRDVASDPAFLEFQKIIFSEIVSKIDNEDLRTALLGTENFRSRVIAIFGDANPNDKAQLQEYLTTYVNSDEFQSFVLNIFKVLSSIGQK